MTRVLSILTQGKVEAEIGLPFAVFSYRDLKAVQDQYDYLVANDLEY